MIYINAIKRAESSICSSINIILCRSHILINQSHTRNRTGTMHCRRVSRCLTSATPSPWLRDMTFCQINSLSTQWYGIIIPALRLLLKQREVTPYGVHSEDSIAYYNRLWHYMLHWTVPLNVQLGYMGVSVLWWSASYCQESFRPSNYVLKFTVITIMPKATSCFLTKSKQQSNFSEDVSRSAGQFPAFYETRRLTAVFTRARSWSLFWAKRS
jgi:hypothetical protein